jgi:hypothetical protein
MKITTTVAMFATTALLLSGCATATESVTPEIVNPSTSTSTEPSTEPSVEPSADPEITAAPKVPVVDKGIATASATKSQLLYLIEEEKLAHDVYSAMFDLWGAKVFGNILKSEETHQGQVLVVLNTHGIDDIRSTKLGVFKNADLQSLYTQLIAKGSKTTVDAYEVGVAIEELDISDLTEMLATAKDADVIAMMENLRRGSENHLRAFNNQL